MVNPRGGGEAGIEGLMSGLKLSEEERRGVRGAWRPAAESKEQAPQAVGKVFATKAASAEGLIQTVGRIWCPNQGIKCKDLGNNLFLFTFLQPGGKRRAVMEGPWECGGDLLIVVDFDGSKRLKDLEFHHSPVWIRVFDLPLGMMNAATGTEIGNVVGKTLMVDVEDDGSAVGGYLRVKARIDIRKPLMRGIVLEEVGGQGGGWCPFEYEFLPNFCYLCGKLGHVEKDCDEKMEEGGTRQFGERLRATLTKGRSLSEPRSRWSGGGSSGGNKYGRSSESWKQFSSKDKERSMAASWRSGPSKDPDLQDDGTSPVKKPVQDDAAKLVQPRAISFEENMEEQGAGKEQNEQDPGLAGKSVLPVGDAKKLQVPRREHTKYKQTKRKWRLMGVNTRKERRRQRGGRKILRRWQAQKESCC